MLVDHWTDSSEDRLQRVLDGQDPFDEQTILDSDSEAEKAVADH